jgi:hypothetical protein
MLALSVAVMGVLAAGAHAQSAPQSVKVQVQAGASYALALKCYQFYDVAGQVASAKANAAKEDGESEADALASRVIVLKAMKAAWNKHIDVAKAGKSGDEIDADLAKAGEAVGADANAGLGGDEEARERFEAIQVECKSYETFEAGRAPVEQIKPVQK